MIMELYIDYCDAKFYHSFTDCKSTIPLMSDKFEVLLDKLSEIKWDSITDSNNLPGIPIKFGPVKITVEDDLDQYRYPISTLKKESRIDVNIKEHDPYHNLDKYWRVRIDMIRIVLLDENEDPLPSPGDELGEEIQSLITFPTIFNDTDYFKAGHTFLCQDYFCPADYYATEAGVTFRSDCSVDEEFTNLNYKPSHDGIFTFFLGNAEQLEMDRLAKVKVEFAGSYIAHPGQTIEWIQ